eukprot:g4568.t1
MNDSRRFEKYIVSNNVVGVNSYFAKSALSLVVTARSNLLFDHIPKEINANQSLRELANKPLSCTGFRPISIACSAGSQNVLRSLIDNHGADPNASESLLSEQFPIHIAAAHANFSVGLELVTILVERGAQINVCDQFGTTPLHVACMHGNLPLTKFLLSCDEINHMAFDESGRTALHFACQTISTAKDMQESKLVIVRQLISYHKRNIKYPLSKNLGRNDNIVETTTNAGETPLMFACKSGSLHIARFLIEVCGANISTTTNVGYNILHAAAHSGSIPLFKFLLDALDGVKSIKPDICSVVNKLRSRSLKTAKLKRNQRDILGLGNKKRAEKREYARQTNQQRRIQLLRQAKAMVDRQQKEADENSCSNRTLRMSTAIGKTPLMIACARLHVGVVNIILRRKVNVNRKTKSGENALLFACYWSSRMLEKGAKEEEKCNSFDASTSSNENKDELPKMNEAELLASSTAAAASAAFLAACESDVAAAKAADTASEVLQHLLESNLSKRRTIVNLLLQHGSSTNVQSNIGLKTTPLIEACKFGDEELCLLLVKHHASDQVKDAHGNDPAKYLSEKGLKQLGQKVATEAHKSRVARGISGKETNLVEMYGISKSTVGQDTFEEQEASKKKKEHDNQCEKLRFYEVVKRDEFHSTFHQVVDRRGGLESRLKDFLEKQAEKNSLFPDLTEEQKMEMKTEALRLKENGRVHPGYSLRVNMEHIEADAKMEKRRANSISEFRRRKRITQFPNISPLTLLQSYRERQRSVMLESPKHDIAASPPPPHEVVSVESSKEMKRGEGKSPQRQNLNTVERPPNEVISVESSKEMKRGEGKSPQRQNLNTVERPPNEVISVESSKEMKRGEGKSPQRQNLNTVERPPNEVISVESSKEMKREEGKSPQRQNLNRAEKIALKMNNNTQLVKQVPMPDVQRDSGSMQPWDQAVASWNLPPSTLTFVEDISIDDLDANENDTFDIETKDDPCEVDVENNDNENIELHKKDDQLFSVKEQMNILKGRLDNLSALADEISSTFDVSLKEGSKHLEKYVESMEAHRLFLDGLEACNHSALQQERDARKLSTSKVSSMNTSSSCTPLMEIDSTAAHELHLTKLLLSQLEENVGLEPQTPIPGSERKKHAAPYPAIPLSDSLKSFQFEMDSDLDRTITEIVKSEELLNKKVNKENCREKSNVTYQYDRRGRKVRTLKLAPRPEKKKEK